MRPGVFQGQLDSRILWPSMSLEGFNWYICLAVFILSLFRFISLHLLWSLVAFHLVVTCWRMSKIRDIFTTFSSHLSWPSLSENIFCLISASLPWYSVFLLFFLVEWKRDRVTLEKMLSLLNKPNKRQLTISIDPRLNFCLLKCNWIAF